MPSFETVSTPNPNSLKFDAHEFTYLDAGMVAASSAAEASAHPLAAAIFALDGVLNVFVTPHFLTVTKDSAVKWDGLLSAIEESIRAFVSTS